MRIGIDGVPLLTPKTGVGRYTDELIKGLKNLDEKPLINLFYGIRQFRKLGKIKGDAPTKEPEIKLKDRLIDSVPFTIKNWLHSTALKMESVLYKPDVFHATNFISDLYAFPLVITIHDLSFIRYPETHPKKRLSWLSKGLLPTIQRTGHIIAVSRFTKNEIISELGVDERKISVVYEGVGSKFKPRSDDSVAPYLKKFRLEPKCYILSVGTLEPRKNILSLLKAYQSLPVSFTKKWPLVISGSFGWKNKEIMGAIRQLEHEKKLILLGYVPDEKLPLIYSGAKLFVFPSFYEGFGLPPLEAMASGVPTVVSNRSSLPEVVGNAGAIIEPEDVRDLSHCIMTLINDSEKQRAMIIKGIKRAKKFTWESCARSTYNIYKQTII